MSTRGLRLAQVRRVFPDAVKSTPYNEPGWGPSFFVACPFGHRKGKVVANINIESGAFHCHDCGKTANCYLEWGLSDDDHFLDDLMPNEGLEPEGYQASVMAGYEGPTWGEGEHRIKAPGDTVPIKSLPQDHPALVYLRDRGVDMVEVLNLPPSLELHYCTHGVFSIAKGMGSTTGRIVFPIYFNLSTLPSGDFNVINPNGWQARQIERVIFEDEVNGEKEVWNGFNWRKFRKRDGYWEDKVVPKYYNCSPWKKSDCLYNFDIAKRYKKVVVVEGVMDVLSVGPAAVGTFGMIPSMAQVNLLKTYWDEVVILRDPGVEPSNDKFKKMIDQLTGIRVTHLTLSGGRDPGSTPRVSIWNQIAAAEHAKTLQVNHSTS